MDEQEPVPLAAEVRTSEPRPSRLRRRRRGPAGSADAAPPPPTPIVALPRRVRPMPGSASCPARRSRGQPAAVAATPRAAAGRTACDPHGGSRVGRGPAASAQLPAVAVIAPSGRPVSPAASAVPPPRPIAAGRDRGRLPVQRRVPRPASSADSGLSRLLQPVHPGARAPAPVPVPSRPPMVARHAVPPLRRFAAWHGARLDAAAAAAPDAGQRDLQFQLSRCHERSERSCSAA